MLDHSLIISIQVLEHRIMLPEIAICHTKTIHLRRRGHSNSWYQDLIRHAHVERSKCSYQKKTTPDQLHIYRRRGSIYFHDFHLRGRTEEKRRGKQVYSLSISFLPFTVISRQDSSTSGMRPLRKTVSQEIFIHVSFRFQNSEKTAI